MKIFGAGMAGLLAAHMLRSYRPVIHEFQSQLPNNHDAVLRFRSDVVSRVTGIPFRKVQVQKAIWWQDRLHTVPDLRMSNLYSAKVTGEVRSRSIINLEPVERWVAPPDFIRQMAASCEIVYDSPLTKGNLPANDLEPFISTMPMPHLMELVCWPTHPVFPKREITSLTGDVLTPVADVFQTIYYPGMEHQYRASLTGNHLTIELMGGCWGNEFKAWHHDLLHETLSHFGICSSHIDNASVHVQPFGKISPISDSERKTFILAMTDKFNIYSLGRFATWRQILLDDVAHDVEVIRGFIDQRDIYQRKIRVVEVRNSFGDLRAEYQAGNKTEK